MEFVFVPCSVVWTAKCPGDKYLCLLHAREKEWKSTKNEDSQWNTRLRLNTNIISSLDELKIKHCGPHHVFAGQRSLALCSCPEILYPILRLHDHSLRRLATHILLVQPQPWGCKETKISEPMAVTTLCCNLFQKLYNGRQGLLESV